MNRNQINAKDSAVANENVSNASFCFVVRPSVTEKPKKWVLDIGRRLVCVYFDRSFVDFRLFGESSLPHYIIISRMNAMRIVYTWNEATVYDMCQSVRLYGGPCTGTGAQSQSQTQTYTPKHKWYRIGEMSRPAVENEVCSVRNAG